MRGLPADPPTVATLRRTREHPDGAVERDTLAHAFGWCPPSLRLLTAWPAWLTTLVQALATEGGDR